MIDLSQVIDIMLGNTPVEQIADSLGNVLWTATPVVLPSYFYVEDISGSTNTLSIKKTSTSAPTIEVFSSTDGANWTSMGNTDTTAITATVPANGKLYLKATADAWGTDRNSGNIRFSTTGNSNIGGYLSSLFVSDNFETDNTDKGQMRCLFQGWTTLVSAGSLIMPTDVVRYGYQNMFYGCTSLTTAPALPATTLGYACYESMFQGCTSLTTAPELPATTLTNYCYKSIFQGCTALTTAPALSATTLASTCYANMFQDCTGLTTAPVLPATTLAQSCYDSMFKNCASLTTAPALPATTLAQSCYYQMFRDCTALTTAPVLPATTLTTSCYRTMFQGCTSLTTAPALPATTLVDWCYNAMFYNCTSLTTAPVLPATTLVDSCYRDMFGACRNLNSVTTYAQDVSAANCMDNWLSGVSSTGDFYNLGGATYPSGSFGIPTGWTEHRLPNYFYVQDITGNTNTLSIVKSSASAPTIEVFKSTDRSNWTSMGTTDTTAITATIPANGKLYLKANANALWCGNSDYNTISASGNHNVGGNIMSLLYSDNFEGQTTFPANSYYTHSGFTGLFYQDTHLINASNLVLPITTMIKGAYNMMFLDCSNLLTAPTSLPNATMADSCYANMFKNCTSLTQAPVILTTTTVDWCASSMFNGCTSLNSVTCYFTNVSPSGCITNWLNNVAATGDFYNLGGATYTSGASGIPSGWTEHTSL